MRKLTTWVLGLFTLALIAGCAQEEMEHEEYEGTEYSKAVVVMHPTEGNDVSGVITFTKQGDGVMISGTVEGLEEGKHGFHIHQYGDCSAADGTSAGGHFNPENVEHGGPNDEVRHVGDLGNIEANADGVAEINMTDDVIKLNGPHSIIGHGVIIHSGEDDFTSQPTGAAGSRLACGVVGIAKGM
jgi:Cu-Zn family superoxide dismutase